MEQLDLCPDEPIVFLMIVHQINLQINKIDYLHHTFHPITGVNESAVKIEFLLDHVIRIVFLNNLHNQA